MGKHEREDVEEMEQTLVKRLNSEEATLSMENQWSDHLDSLARIIHESHELCARMAALNRINIVEGVYYKS